MLSEGQEFYRAADILQAGLLPLWPFKLHHTGILRSNFSLANIGGSVMQAMVQPCQKAAIIPSCRVELEEQPLYLKAKLCTGRCPFLSNKYMKVPAALQARLIQAVSGEQQAAKDSYDRIYKRRSLPALRSSGISFEQCLLEIHAPPCDRLEFCPMSSANPVCLPLCPLRISLTCYLW